MSGTTFALQESGLTNPREVGSVVSNTGWKCIPPRPNAAFSFMTAVHCVGVSAWQRGSFGRGWSSVTPAWSVANAGSRLPVGTDWRTINFSGFAPYSGLSNPSEHPAAPISGCRSLQERFTSMYSKGIWPVHGDTIL